MRGYIAYNLTDRSRNEVITKFYPKFTKVVAHHITVAFNVSDTEPMPSVPTSAKVVGYACNEIIECLVVEINGNRHRADGKLFHVTLSHSHEAKPVMSNDLLQAQGYTECEPFNIEVIPTFNSF